MAADQTHRQKVMRKAFQKLVAEVAYTQNVPADGEEAARLVFFLAAGYYQTRTKLNVVEVLRREVDAANAAMAASK